MYTVLHDMSREFWHGTGFALLIIGFLGFIAGWYFELGVLTIVLLAGGCIMGAGYTLMLGNWSRSRAERDSGDSSGL